MVKRCLSYLRCPAHTLDTCERLALPELLFQKPQFLRHRPIWGTPRGQFQCCPFCFQRVLRGFSNCPIYESTDKVNELYVKAEYCKPNAWSTRSLERSVYCRVGVSHERFSLPGPTSNPRYFPCGRTCIVGHVGMHRASCRWHSDTSMTCNGMIMHLAKLRCRPLIAASSSKMRASLGPSR